MGCLFKSILVCFSVLLALVVLGAALLFAVYWGAPTWTVHEIEERTGFRAEVGSMQVEPWKGRLTLQDLRLLNPEGEEWPEEGFLDVALVEIAAEPIRFWQRRVGIDSVTVRVRSFNTVVHEDGRNNAVAFRDRMLAQLDSREATREAVRLGKKQAPWLDRFVLELDSIRTVDGQGDPYLVEEATVALRVELQDVREVEQILDALLAEAESLGIRDSVDALLEALMALDFFGAFPGEVVEESQSRWEQGVERTGEILRDRFPQGQP